MSRTPVALTPSRPSRIPSASRRAASPRTIGCPLASTCSCVFAGAGQTDRAVLITSAPAGDPAFEAEVAKWIDSGWRVTRAVVDDVSLERPLGLGFCVNAALCIVTGFVWLVYWIPSSRRPRIDTRRVTLTDDGTVKVSRSVARRARAVDGGASAPR